MEHINLNNGWKFSEVFEEQMLLNNYDESAMEEVRLPHTNVVTPFHYFDEQIYQFVSCYRKVLYAKSEWKGNQILLTFEAVGHVAEVYLNQVLITKHEGGYTAFTVDLAPHIKYGEKNNLVVKVDSRESNNLPPFGNVIDYLTYGGIYREVSLEIKGQTSINDAFLMTRDQEAVEKSATKEVELWVTLQGVKNKEEKKRLLYNLKDISGKSIYQNELSISEEVTKLQFCVTGVQNWDIDNPVLYHLELQLYEDERMTVLLDQKRIRFGFRTCEFKKDGFYLNHKKLKLIGLNRHQSYPYVGYAMPKRQQRRDAEILKYELQVNAVRTSHYPQSQHFIDRCDELGLLVFTEIPGWQHIGDEAWKKVAVKHVEEMVTQYRNHPSIILWGVRINESQDDDAFYTKTNRLAHVLDPSRQTGGVRYLQKSNLLEDVYTYNDFLHNGNTPGLSRKEKVTSNIAAPYLISEFNGHMYPTKAYDDEAHRLQHALRHACVLDAIFEQTEVTGGFGWCMFDYNTHKDFGSGDRICYHGVMDMFRNPKLAAAVYASQSNSSEVFELSSSLDIGDHPAGDIREIYAFTNADGIRLYKNNVFIKEFKATRKKYSNLPHPPILIDDFVGELLEKEEHYSHKASEQLKEVLQAVKEYGPNHLPLPYKLKMAWLMLREHLTMEEGARLFYKYIGGWGGQVTSFRLDAVKNGKVLKSIMKCPSSKPSLLLSEDTNVLAEEDTYDVAAIRIRAIDEWGNTLPYFQEPVCFEVQGAIELIGPTTISLKGGMGGAYVKTKGIPGEGELIIRQAQLGEYKLRFTITG